MKNTSTFAKKSVLFVFLLIVVMSSLIISGCATTAPTDAPETNEPAASEGNTQADYAGKKVIFIDSYHQGYAWSDGIESGIHEVLDKTGVDLKIVRLDIKYNVIDLMCAECHHFTVCHMTHRWRIVFRLQKNDYRF